ncbi:MAG: hypothetical protein K6G19_07635 [Lachnospiraceae bacterium]|nr:hypothetical protein [Lachnospiraceae bacterium]
MKKISGLKTAVIAALAVGMFCACGNNAQSGPGTTETAPTSEPVSAAEPTVEAQIEPENDPVIGDIVTTDVESVSIRYYIGYNIATGDAISDVIPCCTVEVNGEELAKLADILPELTKVTVDPDSEEYSHIMYDHFTDYYELTINDDLVLYIGDEYGMDISSGERFAVPAELFDTVESIVEDYSKNNVYKTLGAEQVTVTNMDGKEIEITDQDQLEMLKSYEYYVINADDETFEEEKIAYVVDLHNGDMLEVHFAGVIAKLSHADGSYEYIYIRGIEDYLDCIFSK